MDGDRSRPEHVDAALRDLEWLGLDWDGEPRLQSAGLDRIRDAARTLHGRGRAYPCVCTRGDIRTAQSAPQEGVTEMRYPGTCRGRFETIEQATAGAGRSAGLRFRVPSGMVTIDDKYLGAGAFDVEAEAGDFLITRRDGTPAYQLAVVVDDLVDGVTEVVRGDDLLPSAARQKLLLNALGAPSPHYFHVPLVRDAEGRRLAKREDDLSLSELRAAGTDPRAVVGWVAMCSGVLESRQDEARITAASAVPVFSMARVPRRSVRLTEATLQALRRAR